MADEGVEAQQEQNGHADEQIERDQRVPGALRGRSGALREQMLLLVHHAVSLRAYFVQTLLVERVLRRGRRGVRLPGRDAGLHRRDIAQRQRAVLRDILLLHRVIGRELLQLIDLPANH